MLIDDDFMCCLFDCVKDVKCFVVVIMVDF